MNKKDAADAALQHVDERRRRFLGKLLTGGAVATALPVMTTVAYADEDGQGKGKGKGGEGKGKGGQGKGGPGQGTGPGGAPDAGQLAARLIQSFDKDGDKALNARELEAALKSMFERRMQGQGKGGFSGKGQGGQGKGKGAGKGKGKGAN